MAEIGMIGAGSWGMALAVLLHNNGHQVTIWSALKEEVALLIEKREKCLPTGTEDRERMQRSFRA